jgi:hypothetical protein
MIGDTGWQGDDGVSMAGYTRETGCLRRSWSLFETFSYFNNPVGELPFDIPQ